MKRCPLCGEKPTPPRDAHIVACHEAALLKSKINPYSTPPGIGVVCTREEWVEYRSLKRKRKAT